MAERRTQTADEQPQADDQQEQRLDETVEGGRYKNADGDLVNAMGEPIDKDGKVRKTD